MDITTLIYFKIIAECGSLTKAAKQLHITQPAMSAKLKKLEDELQVELFDRSSNRIYLNKAGESALVHINTILENVEQLKTDVLSVANQNQSLSIAFCDPGVRWYCTPRFSAAHPKVKIKDELYEGNETIKLLQERDYDLIITPTKINDSKIQSLTFLEDHVYLSVPETSNLIDHMNISIRNIPKQALLYPEIGGYFLRQMENIITNDHLPITLVKNNYNITQHLIRTTNFLATISTLSKDLRNDGAHRKLIPLTDPELNVQYYVPYLKSNLNKVKVFLDWYQEEKRSI